MKKLLFLIAFVIPVTLTGQNPWDALRYSRINYQGTARSLALGNAVTALGGDFGSITLNPAASAVYPYSEISITPSLVTAFSEVDYFSQRTNDRNNRPGLSSLGYTGSWNTSNGSGLVSLSFALGYNKVQDFTTRTSVRRNNSESSWLTPVATMTNGIFSADLEHGDNYNPYYDSGAPWRSVLAWNAYLLDTLPGTQDQYIAAPENLYGEEIVVGGPLDQRFTRESIGSMGEYTLNMGANINNRIFFGYSLNFRSVYYKTYEKFIETAQDPEAFQTWYSGFSHTYDQTTTGIGFNMNLGIIAIPVNLPGFSWRLGASIATPVWTSLTDEWQEHMTAEFLDLKKNASSPVGSYSYNVRTPWRFSAGTAFIIGKVGLISFDYEGADYRTMKMSEKYDKWAFEQDNEAIRYGSDTFGFKYAHNFRAGAEIRVSRLAIRGGYSFYGAPERSYEPSHIVSGGLGLRGDQFFTDLGVSYRLKEGESFSLYDTGSPSIPGYNSLSQFRILFTLGFRF
ncbi:MAG: hypothetical protein PHT35_06410 [Bacteroidales bacterium]|nr:hypothetical protein [Bacteroidales bacterium]MDD3522268.1 hypothetical protein [Bacteroidales bacterium]MDD4030583.1 hypothetical protein [Bacteroidales bacterium]MDD4435684.1 hypothetical protein [Bacteroidales bacterium]